MTEDYIETSRAPRSMLRSLVIWLLLGLLLMAGLHIRTIHLADWDGKAYLHPDERFLIYTVYHLRVPHSFADYLTTTCPSPMPAPSKQATQPHEIDEPSLGSGCSTLNPRNFNWSRGYVYGSLPMTLTRIAAEKFQRAEPEGIMLVGRALSTTADLLVVLLVYLTGARLFGRRAGLLGAALYTFTVLGIQQSHFFTTDTFAACFSMLALYWSVRLSQADGAWPRPLVYALAIGLGIGAAVASKINLVALALLPLLAALQWSWRNRDPLADDWWSVCWRAVPPLFLAGLATFFTFRIANPDAFSGPGFFDVWPDKRFLQSINSVKALVTGEQDYPPSHQWTDRPAWLFPWYNMVLWGMGLALGLTAWAGWLAALWRLLRRKQGAFLLLVIWIGLYFLWQGQQFAKTLRYMLPIYGPLIILAGWALDRLLARAARLRQLHTPSTRHRWLRPTLCALPALVVVATFLWGWGFSRIYARPHPRIAATEWVRANITTDKILTNEMWDDALPHTVGEYTQPQTHPYEEDSPEKVRRLVETLEQADYVTLTSNRVYGSVARLPMRYPATNRYYEELFRCASDERCPFGFELVADFSSYPSFFGLPIPDQQLAEEAFSVYDHPRVLIFKKRPDFSAARAYQLLTRDIAWGEIYRLRPVEATEAPTALRLTEEQWQGQRGAGTWSDLIHEAQGELALLEWLLLTEALGLATFGLLFALRLPLPDRGLSLARPIALILLAYVAWLLASLRVASFSRGLLATLVLILLVSGGAALRARRAELRLFLRERRWAIIGSQGLYAGAFLLFLTIRYFNPDLWHPAMGGEKPMELAFLIATIKSAYFPPYDPWFVGGYINYYYWGFVLVAAPMKLLAIDPALGFNLALPMLYGWTALGAWGVVYNLLSQLNMSAANKWGWIERRAILAGYAAALFLVLVGNLAQVPLYLNGLRMLANPQLASDTFFKQGLWLENETGDAIGQVLSGLGQLLAGEKLPFRPEWPYWNATRVVPGTVNEFPFFSFLYGDLHAHVIALPLTLVALGLIAGLLRAAHLRLATSGWASATTSAADSRWELRSIIAPTLLLALVVGALRATNTWDYPTLLVLSLAAIAVAAFSDQDRSKGQAALRGALLAALLIAGSLLLFLPWSNSFASAYSKLQAVEPHERIGMRELVANYGLWLFILLSYGVYVGRRAMPSGLRLWLGATLLAWTINVWLIDGAALLALAPLAALGIWLLYAALTGNIARRQSVPLGLAVAGLLILIGTELITLSGAGRMNTVFKFGYQVWTLWAIASALALPTLLGGLRNATGAASQVGRQAWRTALALLVAAALLYPLTATPARVSHRIAEDLPHTLDGAAFLQWGEISEGGVPIPLRADALAIDWLRANVEGTPAIAEAHLPSYRWGGRVATWTGLPTLLGWETHERQQRAAVNAAPIIDSRKLALVQLYSARDKNQMLELLKRYGIEYIYVGHLERAVYGGDANAAYFDSLVAEGLLTLAYNQYDVRIYRVVTPWQPLVLHEPANVVPPDDSVAQRLMLPRPVAELPVVAEYADAEWLNDHQWAAVLLWVLLWEGLGLLALPIATLIFGRRRDAGWGWAKLIGLIIWGYLVWLPVSLGFWLYTRLALLLGLLGLMLLSLAALRYLTYYDRSATGRAPGSLLADLRAGLAWLISTLWQGRRAILVSEVVFLSVFAFWTLLRALNPDLWHPFFGGEKPFEFGMLNAILRSPSLPPYDPFYSGGIVNYYYYGLYLVSLPVKALGLDPAIAFNLIVPTIGALTAAGALAVTLAITARLRWALTGVFSLLFLSSLGGAVAIGQSRGLCGVYQALTPSDGSQGGPLARLLCGEAGIHGSSGSFAERLGWWFWGPSRLIYVPDKIDTINEFPYWALLFADLHPHLIALPVTVLVIGLAFELAAGGRHGRLELSDLSALLLVPLVIGALALSNSWDLPTYALLLVLALLLRGWRRWGAPDDLPLMGWPPLGWRRVAALPGWPLLGVGLIGLGLLLYLPFFGHYWAPVKGVGLVKAERASPMIHFLAVYGLLIFSALLYTSLSWGKIAGGRRQAAAAAIIALVLISNLFARAIYDLPQQEQLLGIHLGLLAFYALVNTRRERRSLPTIGALLIAALVISASVVAPERVVAAHLAGLLALAVWALPRRALSPAAQFAMLLITVGLAVALGMEIVFIRDHLDGGIAERMNTVFKFGFQVWTLLALAAAAALPRILAGMHRLQHPLFALAKGLVLGVACVLLLGSLVFTLVGPFSRIGTRFEVETGLTLDGLAFMEQATYSIKVGGQPASISLAPDAAAIAWMKDNLHGSPIVLQSEREFYRTYGVRIAANTGLPTVLGRLHADEQRPPAGVYAREKDVERIYTTTDPAEALQLLGRYRVDYVYIGPLERALYAGPGLEKFDAMLELELVYENAQARLYRAGPEVRDFARRPLAGQQQGALNGGQPPAPAGPADNDRLALLEAAYEANPDDIGAAFALGQAYRDAGQHARSVEVLQQAAEKHPRDVPIRHLLGDVLRDAGLQAEAEAAYRDAIAIDPSASNISKLGQELIGWGKLDQAELVLNEALATDPAFPYPHYFLGEIYVRRGDHDRARQEFEIFLANTKEGEPYYDFAQQKLQELQ